jgi:hypothetical protein
LRIERKIDKLEEKVIPESRKIVGNDQKMIWKLKLIKNVRKIVFSLYIVEFIWKNTFDKTSFLFKEF